MNNNNEEFLDGGSILITGGTGSWGNELVGQLIEKFNLREIRIYSRGEHKQVEMRRKFSDPRIKYYIGDVRDQGRLKLASKGVDVIFHLAALKHVPVCEENPWEAVQTNILGTQNVIKVAIENNVSKVVDVSTDKAVDPLNLYGVTKACGEKLIIAANLISEKTKFVCVRGGNVIGTNGSVVPLFKEQLKKLNALTITDRRMTRFLMRVEEAIELVIHATMSSYGGEVFVLKMPGCKINDLAEVMKKRLGNQDTKIKLIGIRPGEKLYEVLVSRYEVERTRDKGDYYVILPQIDIPDIKSLYDSVPKMNSDLEEFNSNNAKSLALDEIDLLLETDGWFEDNLENEAMRYLNSLSKENLEDFFK